MGGTNQNLPTERTPFIMSLRALVRLLHSADNDKTAINPTLSHTQGKDRKRPKQKPSKKQKKRVREAFQRKHSTQTDESGDGYGVSFELSSDDEDLYDITEAPICDMKLPTQTPRKHDFKEIQWQIGGLLGTGSYGSVHMALNIKTGELMAVKQVPILDGSVTEPVENLQREIEILSSLRHNNIVRYLGTAREDNTLNIFLEYITGGSIQSLLAKMGPFPEEVISVYTKQILYGLEYLHSNNIVHRDIKGGNILVSNDGVIKLADFGASKKLEDVVDPKKSSLKGTVCWMAPEVARQESGCGKEVDVWSLGCTVFEMATGQPPWNDFPDQVSVLYHLATLRSPPSFKSVKLSSIGIDFLKQCFVVAPHKRKSVKALLEHPFVNHSTASPLKDSANTSYSSPDYNQSPSKALRAAKKQHRRNKSADNQIPGSEGSKSSTVTKPVASPFVFLQRSQDSVRKKSKLS